MPSILTSLTEHYGRYISKTVWLFTERIARIILQLTLGIAIARYLGPDQFGLLSYGLSFVGLFSALTVFCAQDVLVYELVTHPRNYNNILGSAVALNIFGTLLAILAILVTTSLINEPNESLIILIITSALLVSPLLVTESFFFAKGQRNHIAVSYFLQLLIGAIVKVILLFIKAPLIWFAFAFMLDTVILAASFFSTYSLASYRATSWRPDLRLVISYIRQSWPLLLSGVAVSIYMKIDQVMINFFMDTTAVGNYAVAVQVSQAWYFIPIILSSAIFPTLLKSRAHSHSEYYYHLQNLFRILSAFSILVAIVMTMVSKTLVIFIFGNEYADAATVLQIHIWTGIFVCFGVLSGKWLVSENLTKVAFYRTFVGMILNVGLNFIFIPNWGINGAAIATLISQMVTAYIYDYFDDRTIGMFRIKTKAILFPLPVKYM